MGAGHDFRGPEDEAQGRVLEQDGKFVGPAGDGQAQGLRKDDMPDGLPVVHAEGAGRAELAHRERLDGAAENLGLVGRARHAEDEAGRRDGGQVQADDLEQPEIEEEQQEQDGHSPEKPHIDADEAADERRAVHLQHGEGKADAEPERQRSDDGDEGYDAALKDVGQRVENNRDFVHYFQHLDSRNGG